MKIRIKTDDTIDEIQINIQAPADTPNLKQLKELLKQWDEGSLLIIGKRRGSEHRLTVSEILFFQTDDHQVYAHTNNQMFQVDQRLYELEKQLPKQFVRVAKSAIINLDKLDTLTHSLTERVVTFQHSSKEIFVSRRYYKSLKQQLNDRSL